MRRNRIQEKTRTRGPGPTPRMVQAGPGLALPGPFNYITPAHHGQARSPRLMNVFNIDVINVGSFEYTMTEIYEK